MKNKGLIITLIVLATITIVFSIAILAVYFIGGKSFNIILWGSKTENVVFDKSFLADDIQSIEIKQDAGDVTIKESPNDEIRVILYGEREEDANVNLNDNKLTIDFSHKKKFKFKEKLNDIVIYIPSNYSDEIKIVNNAGECNMGDFEETTIDFEFNAGNVVIGKIKNAKIKCDVGNIEINEVLNKCNIDSECGNIKIDTISIKENSSIKTNVGNVEINQANGVYIDGNANAGNANIKNNDRNAAITLKIDCDLGNIDVRK